MAPQTEVCGVIGVEDAEVRIQAQRREIGRFGLGELPEAIVRLPEADPGDFILGENLEGTVEGCFRSLKLGSADSAETGAEAQSAICLSVIKIYFRISMFS